MALLWKTLVWEFQVVWWIVGLVAGLALFFLRGGVQMLRRVSQRQSAMQELPAKSPPPAAPVQIAPAAPNAPVAPGPAHGFATPAPVNVTVTVNNNLAAPAPAAPAAPAPPTAQPEPATAPAEAVATVSARHVMEWPDHRIYATTGSHMMVVHPFEAELLEDLDRWLFTAAMQPGSLFVPLDLDGSSPLPGVAQVPRLPPLDGEIDPVPPRPVPVADGLLWMVGVGRDYARLVGSRSG